MPLSPREIACADIMRRACESPYGIICAPSGDFDAARTLAYTTRKALGSPPDLARLQFRRVGEELWIIKPSEDPSHHD